MAQLIAWTIWDNFTDKSDDFVDFLVNFGHEDSLSVDILEHMRDAIIDVESRSDLT